MSRCHANEMNLRDLATVGDVDGVNKLLNSGADIECKNAYGHTALINAAHNGHIEIVKLLLDWGASIDSVDIQEENALMCAARKGSLDIVQLLINAGTNIDAKDIHGVKAKHKAKYYGHMDCYHLLRDEKRRQKGGIFKGTNHFKTESTRSRLKHLGGQSLSNAMAIDKHLREEITFQNKNEYQLHDRGNIPFSEVILPSCEKVNVPRIAWNDE